MSSLEDRKREVPSDFDRVSRTYDLLTGANPGYRRHLRLTATRLAAPPAARILDLCCGTGLSTEALRRVYPSARLVGLDASAGMLAVARGKRALADVTFLHGDAMAPRASGLEGEFDAILMAYGIRNMPDPDLCLERLKGLLRPGGTIGFHEYSVADSFVARRVWDAVCYGIIVPGGLLTAGTSRIYRYLHQSVVTFDGVRGFEERLRRHGFDDVHTEPMDGWQRGILHSFLATKPLETKYRAT